MKAAKTTPSSPKTFAGSPEGKAQIADHQLLRRVGQGSYGEVWLARSMMGSWRAIKIIARGGESAAGFERELAGLRKFEPISRTSAGLVHILQVGEDPGHQFFYYIMELADDGNCEEPWSVSHDDALRGKLDAETYVPRTLGLEKRRRGRLPAEECLRIALALSEALASLHERGLVHRDLKPSNIIFVHGQPKLADIGLVAEMTEANSYVGTEGYIPPEGPNSPQGDIYSLGKVLYEISTGKDRQDFPEPITIVEEGERALIQELNAIILKAAHPDFFARYRSAAEMRDDLLLLRSGKSVRKKRGAQRRIKWMACAGAAVSVLALIVTLFDRVLESRVRSIQGQSTLIKPALIGRIQPRDDSAPSETIDLSAYYTAPLIEPWYPGPKENTLASLPRGIQNFDRVNFDVRGLVQLSGGEISAYQAADLYPRQMRAIPVDRWAKRLHFLQGAVSEVSDGRQIGAYQVEYATGRIAEIPIVYGRDLRALWQPADTDGIATNSVLVWTGQNPPTRERNMALRLYKQTWENPWPNDQIVHIDFRSAMANSAPFLIALTCDEHEPPADQKQLPIDLIASLQAHAGSFQEIQPALTTGLSELKTYKFKENPIKIGSQYFDGIRFRTPSKQSMDFAWAAFVDKSHFHSRGWHILPLQGHMKVGFEDWYHQSNEESATNDNSALRLQFLAGKKLQPGHEYFIWFVFDDPEPTELKALLHFVPTGEINPNQPDSIVRALGLEKSAGSRQMKFHRHYCLGAVR